MARGVHGICMHFFVTGTDTGVGKTYFTALLLRSLRDAGIGAVGYKPVSCGDRADAEILAAVSGGPSIDEINPLHFKTAVAPHVASMLEGGAVDPSLLTAGFRHLADRHGCVIVEGAGGWEVPLAAGYRVSDLAEQLALPVIVVAANRLGALNHILLTVAAVRARGLTCAGIVLNQLADELDTAMITNRGVVEDLTGVPLLDLLIRDHDTLAPAALEILGFGQAG